MFIIEEKPQTDLDTSYKNYGNIYILGCVFNSNNVYMYSNLNVNGNIGIGKTSISSIELQ